MCSRFLKNEGVVKFQVQILIQVWGTRSTNGIEFELDEEAKQVTEDSRQSSFEAKSYQIP